jgi:hypothetical protein
MSVPFSTFALLTLEDVFSRRPPRGSTEEHLQAAEQWLVRAHDVSPDDGVSYGYSIKGGWRDSYRETSGYIASTFFRLARDRGDRGFEERGLRVARWLLSVQNADGSFSNPRYGSEGIVFDTGQDLFGLVHAFEVCGDPAFLEGARRAARWLVDIAGDDGRWTRNEHLGTPHVYNTRTAWALLRLNERDPHPDWERAARANLDWAVSQQQPSGFFDHCAFERGADPFTHTIAYATRGLLESGLLLGDERYVDSARRCAEAALRHLRDDGFLPGKIAVDGSPAASYVCLTGNCQFALNWARLDRLEPPGGDRHWRRAAARALDFVMDHQDIATSNADVRGAIKGSQPVWGGYAPLSFPNWATKFFIDAMWMRKAWEVAA